MKPILLGLGLLMMGIILPFLMVIGILEPGFGLSFLAYAASLAGLALGITMVIQRISFK